MKIVISKKELLKQLYSKIADYTFLPNSYTSGVDINLGDTVYFAFLMWEEEHEPLPKIWLDTIKLKEEEIFEIYFPFRWLIESVVSPQQIHNFCLQDYYIKRGLDKRIELID